MDYQRIYNQIIERAKNRKLEGYKEKHHIIPKCLGGTNDKENLIELTAREHFLCHMLLCEIYPKENKLKQALWLMAINKNKKNNRYKVSSRVYERSKTNNILILKQIIPIKKRNHKCYKDPERGQKISKSLNGYKQNISHINKRKKANSKPVLQYDLEGNFIKEWSSATEAASFFKGKSNNIQNNCMNRTKSAYGFKWKYKHENKS